MTAIFITDDPEQKRRILKSDDAYAALWDIEQMLRTFRKSDSMDYDDVMQKFQDILGEHDIRFDLEWS